MCRVRWRGQGSLYYRYAEHANHRDDWHSYFSSCFTHPRSKEGGLTFVLVRFVDVRKIRRALLSELVANQRFEFALPFPAALPPAADDDDADVEEV